MRAMILAAGRGERMGKLTEHYPKPLVKLGGRYLIEYSLLALAKMGIQEIVINTCYRHALIQQVLGNGHRYGVQIEYSVEEELLGTGGGIYKVLPLLGDQPFLVISSDIVTDFLLKNFVLPSEKLAHLLFVDNPSYHLKGDFALENKQVMLTGSTLLTFGSISLLHPKIFDECGPGYFKLGDLLKEKIALGQVTGEYYPGLWFNIGTPNELSRAETIFIPSVAYPF